MKFSMHAMEVEFTRGQGSGVTVQGSVYGVGVSVRGQCTGSGSVYGIDQKHLNNSLQAKYLIKYSITISPRHVCVM